MTNQVTMSRPIPTTRFAHIAATARYFASASAGHQAASLDAAAGTAPEEGVLSKAEPDTAPAAASVDVAAGTGHAGVVPTESDVELSGRSSDTDSESAVSADVESGSESDSDTGPDFAFPADDHHVREFSSTWREAPVWYGSVDTYQKY